MYGSITCYTTQYYDDNSLWNPNPNPTLELMADVSNLTNNRPNHDHNKTPQYYNKSIFGIFSYGFGFVGAIAFMQFALYAFRKGKPEDRNADYFRGRLGFYSMMCCIGGLCQILLGSFATELTIEDGRIAGGLLRVAMFVIHVPYVTIFVGCWQFLCGFWGFCRSCYVFVRRDPLQDDYFQYCMALLWVIVLTCQDIVQVSLLPEGMLAPTAPTFAALSFGVIFMPAYLDYKMRHTPMEIDESYYFGTEPSPTDEVKPMMQARSAVPRRKPLEVRKVYVMERPGIVDDDYYDGPGGRDVAPYIEEEEQEI